MNLALGLWKELSSRMTLLASLAAVGASYDLNYRASLWKSIGGKARAQEVNREIAKYVDVMIGNEEDFTAALGIEVEGVDANLTTLPVDSFGRMIERARSEFPNFKAVATTLRAVKSATVNDWSALCWYKGKLCLSAERPGLEIYDRVGGGDSFASGLVYGFMTFDDAAKAVNREIAKYVDVMIGNEEDFTAALGIAVEGVDKNMTTLPIEGFRKMIDKAVSIYPNFKAVATTLRSVKSATVNDWSAICWYKGELHESIKRPGLEIYDRVGGGDSFASGLVYGFMTFDDAAKAVNYGAAHGALAMTTPGDTSMATKADVEKLVGGGSARVDR